MRSKLDRLLRKKVEVRAGGFTYRGTLIEVTQSEIILRGPTGFITVPMERVTSVEDPLAPEKRARSRMVDKSFYDADLPPSEEKEKKE